MAFCRYCGEALQGAGRFCVHCGRAVDAAGGPAPAGGPPPQGAAPQWAPPQSVAPVAQWATSQTGGGFPPPPTRPSRSRKGLWIALGAAIVVVAIAAVLVFAVFGVGGGGTAAAKTPEGTVNRFLAAMEAKDIDKVLDLMEPQVRESLVKVGGLKDAKKTLSDTMFPFKSVKFSNIKLSTKKSSETNAAVTINAGTATIIGNDGKSTKSDIATDMPITFDLMQKDGSWYLLSSSFF